jgi:type VI secretion system protein VasI
MRTVTPILSILGLLAAGPGWAVEPRDCAALDDDKLRLACYDEAHRGAAAGPPGEGKWRVTQQVSKIDDSPEVFVAVEAADPLPGPEGRTSTGILMISCREGNTDVFLNFGEHAMTPKDAGAARDAVATVTTRVDKNRARRIAMRPSRDRKALGLWSGRRAIPFVKDMLGATRLFVRASPPDEAALDMEFEIAGLDAAVKPLRQACRW